MVKKGGKIDSKRFRDVVNVKKATKEDEEKEEEKENLFQMRFLFLVLIVVKEK